jgi:hypothetical protein
MKRDVSTSEALRTAWTSLRMEAPSFLLLGAASVMLVLISHSLAEHGGWWGAAFILPAQMLHALVGLVLIRAAMRQLDDQPVDLSRAAPLLRNFGRFCVTTFLYVVLVSAGVAFFVVPGVLLGVALLFAPIAAAQGAPPLAAFHVSRKLTRGVRGQLLGLVAVLALINVAGLLALGFGAAVTVPLSTIALVVVFRSRVSPGLLPVERREEVLEQPDLLDVVPQPRHPVGFVEAEALHQR